MALRIAVAALAAASFLPVELMAQVRTWIVDAANSPATDFTDLPPAVAAAGDGDTIVVRAGVYGGFRTGKALTVLGEGFVRVSMPVDPLAVCEIVGLPAGRSFAIKNIAFMPTLNTSASLRLTDDLGRVHLEEVWCASQVNSLTVNGACTVSRCAQVTITGGRLDGYPGLSVSNSTVVLAGVAVHGGSACYGSLCAGIDPTAGITVFANSLLELSRTDVLGGSGVVHLLYTKQPQPAIVVSGGAVLITGDAATTIAAGTLAGGQPTAAIRTTGGALYIDPAIAITSSNGAPPIVGQGALVVDRFASLVAAGAPPGGIATAELVSPAGDPYLLVASLPADLLWSPAGPVFVDAATLIQLASGVQGPTEHAATSIPVPSVAALRGGRVVFQALSLSVASGSSQLSTPAVIVLD